MAWNFNKEFEVRDLRNGDWYWVNQIVLSDTRLTPADNKVYSGLTCFVNQGKKGQIVYPSVNTIAKKVVLSPRQVKASTKRLEETKYIQKIPNQEGNRTAYVLLKVSSAKFALVQKTAESGANFSKSGADATHEVASNNPTNKNIEQNTNINISSKPRVYGNSLVNLTLKEFERVIGFTPTDRKPRWEAQIFIRKMTTALKKKLTSIPNERLEKAIIFYFDWISSKDWATGIQTMSGVRRKLPVFLAEYKL